MEEVVRVSRRTLAWGECDPAGIIFYPNYYRWMDEGTWALFAQAGYPPERMRADHFSLPLVNAACDFLASPVFGDEIEIRTRMAKWGRSSFSVAHEFVRASDGNVLARGMESRVWCRYEGGPGTPLRSVPIPAEVRTALAASAA
ncbi:MAG: acyl-CoA thioesterase [Variovorax sp.]